MLSRRHQTKLVLPSEESLWKIKRCANGTSERMISRDSKMKGSIYFKVLWLREKKKVKRNMLRGLKRLDLRRPKIRKEPWQRSRERGLRF